jgi:hypothetical protein
MTGVSTGISRVATIVVAAIVSVFVATSADAGITSIRAHSKDFGATATIPVFVDSSAKTSIIVKGQFMDLATGVSTSNSSFSASIGRRIMGSNSSIEILVGVGIAVADGTEATVRIHFVSGEERVRVKAHKTRIDSIATQPPRVGNKYKVGEMITLLVDGVGVDHIDSKGAAAAMLRLAANSIYTVSGPASPQSTSTRAVFTIDVTKTGTFSVTKDFFRDNRHQSPVGELLVRGAPAAISITVESAPLIRTPVP